MKPRSKSHCVKSVLLGSSMLAASAALFPVLAQDNSVEAVTVTGYAASLEKSIDAKRSTLNFSDTVFAQDIGKFPDSNIAESLNRIPGITITRDSTGEGVNVSIRGLGTNFTKILLNNAQIAMASTGPIDQQNNNREVDLNMFPTELFTQLTVSKSPSADQLEGGAAGTVNMRSARPFDTPGLHVTGSIQGTDYSKATGIGEHGTIIASDTIGPFGALLGLSGGHAPNSARYMSTEALHSIGFMSRRNSSPESLKPGMRRVTISTQIPIACSLRIVSRIGPIRPPSCR